VLSSVLLQKLASENVKIVHPYVKMSIMDSVGRGKEIGCRDTGNINMAYRPLGWRKNTIL
jgi:hypothetical protein